jgi:ethanolamine ammonia-lyase small subunit
MTDPWHNLRQFTQARIAQGRAGSGLPTAALLEFQLAHAFARDAVHQVWDYAGFAQQLQAGSIDSLTLQSQVGHRIEYLQRPDKGRCLHPESKQILAAYPQTGFDAVLIISNGLSSTALDKHGLGLLTAIQAQFQETGLKFAPVCLISNARVAVADEIGELLNCRLAIILIGERPGLTAADSIGIYLTNAPKIGNTDAQRNCISNIREPDGLGYQQAAAKLCYLSSISLQRGISGVYLKDDMPKALT